LVFLAFAMGDCPLGFKSSKGLYGEEDDHVSPEEKIFQQIQRQKQQRPANPFKRPDVQLATAVIVAFIFANVIHASYLWYHGLSI